MAVCAWTLLVGGIAMAGYGLIGVFGWRKRAITKPAPQVSSLYHIWWGGMAVSIGIFVMAFASKNQSLMSGVASSTIVFNLLMLFVTRLLRKRQGNG
jgi:FtsH-binding integral membrane protein